MAGLTCTAERVWLLLRAEGNRHGRKVGGTTNHHRTHSTSLVKTSSYRKQTLRGLPPSPLTLTLYHHILVVIITLLSVADLM